MPHRLGAYAGEPQQFGFDVQRRDAVPKQRVFGRRTLDLDVFEEIEQDRDGSPALPTRSAAERHPLAHQRRDGHPPALPFLAEHVLVRDAHVVQEDLVEFCFASDLIQRPHLDAWRVHVEHEIREAVVLGNVRVGARDEQPPLRYVRECRPGLLAVDHPRVSVAHRARRESGDIRSRRGFAEELTPDVFAREDTAQQLSLAVLFAVGEHDGRTHADPDRIHQHVFVVGFCSLVQLVVDDGLQLRLEAQAPESFGKTHPRQAAIELGSAELDAAGTLGVRIDLSEQFARAFAQLGLVHRHSPLNRHGRCAIAAQPRTAQRT